jgi:hypothetical protein
VTNKKISPLETGIAIKRLAGSNLTFFESQRTHNGPRQKEEIEFLSY